MANMVRPLAGVRIIEASMLGPAATTTALADLGADVIKVEPPGGDYGRRMTWPIVEGTSLLFLHANRGKRSIVLDLRTADGVDVFLDLVRGADAVVEAMRPGGLERRGLGFDALQRVNPAIVFVTISGYGMTGPYRNLPSHGIAYDAWAGIIQPTINADGFTEIPPHTSVGINVGPVYGALAVLAGITQARATGRGLHLEVAQSDAAASMDWLRSETYRAYERPDTEVTGNPTDDFERRPPGTEGMQQGVRYQIYPSSDGHILFMASEREFWKNFCDGIGRPELFDRWPGEQFADHARGNVELRRILTDIFATRSTQEWVSFAGERNTPIAPVNNSQSIANDPQFQNRMPWLPASAIGADQLPNPIKPVSGAFATPRRAPDLGADTVDVLRSVLGFDDDRIASLHACGAFGAADATGLIEGPA